MTTSTEPTELSALISQSPSENRNVIIRTASTSIINDIALQKWDPPALTDKISSESRSQLMTYLTRFGYEQDSTSNEEDNFTASLKSFQKYSNLPITGTYDEPTRTLMSKPRCSHPDLKKSTTTAGPNSFVNSGIRWNKTNLTYRFAEFTPDLTPAKQRRAIADGFATWAAVTPLSFKEVDSGEDITLHFITGRFGQFPENVFDGPGGLLA